MLSGAEPHAKGDVYDSLIRKIVQGLRNHVTDFQTFSRMNKRRQSTQRHFLWAMGNRKLASTAPPIAIPGT